MSLQLLRGGIWVCLLRSLFRYPLHLITLAGKLAGYTLDMKQCLDFRRLAAGI